MDTNNRILSTVIRTVIRSPRAVIRSRLPHIPTHDKHKQLQHTRAPPTPSRMLIPPQTLSLPHTKTHEEAGERRYSLLSLLSARGVIKCARLWNMRESGPRGRGGPVALRSLPLLPPPCEVPALPHPCRCSRTRRPVLAVAATKLAHGGRVECLRAGTAQQARLRQCGHGGTTGGVGGRPKSGGAVMVWYLR